MAANANNGWCPELPGQLPPGGVPGMAASEQAGQGQLLVYNSAGYVTVVTGAVPCLVAAGVANEKLTPGSPSNAVAGQSKVVVWTGYGGGAPASEENGDNFTIADTCTPAWGASSDALGKLSNLSGSNRPLMGLVFGLTPFVAQDSDGTSVGTPRAWVGPVAQAVARGVLMATDFPHAWFTITDAAASTATTERAIPRAKLHGLVTRIEFVGAAIAADNTDYVTITIAKRGLADAYAAATTLGTYDSRAANNGAISAFTPAAFTLSVVAHALELLETDVVTIAVVKGGSGKQLIGEFLVDGKVI